MKAVSRVGLLAAVALLATAAVATSAQAATFKPDNTVRWRARHQTSR
jgi:hypothetical protein